MGWVMKEGDGLPQSGHSCMSHKTIRACMISEAHPSLGTTPFHSKLVTPRIMEAKQWEAEGQGFMGA